MRLTDRFHDAIFDALTQLDSVRCTWQTPWSSIPHRTGQIPLEGGH